MQEQRVEVGLEAGSFDKRMFRANVSDPFGSDVAHIWFTTTSETDILRTPWDGNRFARSSRRYHSLFFSPGEWNARLKLVKEDINDGSQRYRLCLARTLSIGSDLEGNANRAWPDLAAFRSGTRFGSIRRLLRFKTGSSIRLRSISIWMSSRFPLPQLSRSKV